MPFDFTFHVLMPLTMLAIALAFIALGLYALIRRRPFIIHARWLLVIIVVAFSPNLFTSLSALFGADRYRSGSLGLMSLLTLVAMLVLIGFMALQMRGYMVYGTTQESFRDALMAALSDLHLKAEETLSSIRLPSVPAELQVAVYGWLGSGQLRLRNGGRPGLLADIAAGMDAHFNSARVKTNMISALVFLTVGVLLGAMVVLLMREFR
jgi:hypothetical protein